MSIYINLLLILFSFIVFVFCVFYLTARYKRIILGICVVFVAIGFSLYTASYLSSGMGLAATLFAALRGIFSVARMLSINDDHGVLVDMQGTQWLTESIYVQILFWFCHVAALIIVYTALISLFGRKLIDSFRLSFGPQKELYMIKGIDKNALLLAENIATHDAEEKSPDKKRLIIFLLDEEDDEEKIHKKVSHFGGIVQMLDKKHDLSYYLKKAKLGKRNFIIKEKKYNIVLMPKDAYTLDDVQLIADFAEKNAVNPDNLDIFVFTFSEWDREKIEEITLAKDEIEDVIQAKENINPKRKYPYTFHIVNEVELLTRQMIEKHPPFECPRLNFSGGKTEHNFTVMILGFGPLGQSALLRLLMNGQFVGSRMRAIIVDKDINDLRDCFLHRYPGLELCCDMEFENISVQCKKYFTLLDKEMNVDYIVAALHDDEKNKQTALDIKNHYERKGIRDLPFIAVAELNGSLHETKQDEKIFVFGCREDIYKESVIIREKADRMAKTVNNVYNKKTKNPKKRKDWTERDWFEQESNRAVADFIPAMLKLAGIKRDEVPKEGPLVRNNATLAEVLAQTEHLRWNAFHVAMGWKPVSMEEMRQSFDYTGSKEPTARLHVCLVSWDKLDKISEEYKEDFKKYDREIIENIPLFLREAEKACPPAP